MTLPEQNVPTCWDTLVREHAAGVLGAACRVLGNTADAEEVSQEVFLEAFQKWRRRDRVRWPYMLRRLAVYRALDRRRRRKFTASSDELAAVPGREAGPVDTAVAVELSELLRLELDRLPAREAEVFCLRHFEGLEHSEIADALEIKPGAVAVALYKARAKLSERLSRAMRGD
jgi:RNA polymerase sigma-70 factor (ECF subfamily)